jgi:hypothetical protein
MLNINWNQLVKYLSDSKPITGAVFITSLIFVIGTKFKLVDIPQLPDSIYMYAFGILIFSGSLLAISVLMVAYEKSTKKIISIAQERAKKNLSELEKAIVIEFRDVGSEVMHSTRIIKKHPKVTMIEVLNAVTLLEKKGLLRVAHDRNYFWLKKGNEALAIKLANNA